MSSELGLYEAMRNVPITREAAEAILSLKKTPSGLLDLAGAMRDIRLGRELRLYYPLPRFPSISVTGDRCSLRCKHCGGYYLRGMAGVETPSKLKRFCTKLEAEGGVGLLMRIQVFTEDSVESAVLLAPRSREPCFHPEGNDRLVVGVFFAKRRPAWESAGGRIVFPKRGSKW